MPASLQDKTTSVLSFLMNYLFELLVAAAAIALPAAMMIAHVTLYRRRWQARAKQKQFAKFNQGLANETSDQTFVRKVLDGVVKIEHPVYIIFPTCLAKEELWDRFVEPLSLELLETGVGTIERTYSIGRCSGIDIHLTDYVSGVGVIRSFLLERSAPDGTIIEHAEGELDIYG